MRRRILDTNMLVNHWGDKLRANPRQRPTDVTEAQARAWAKELIRIRQTRAIFTPIYLEYICGKPTKQEVQVARAFLSEFEILDQGNIMPADWAEASRIAQRVPRGGGKRQLGDCLIKALCNRFGYDPDTADKRFPV